MLSVGSSPPSAMSLCALHCRNAVAVHRIVGFEPFKKGDSITTADLASYLIKQGEHSLRRGGRVPESRCYLIKQGEGGRVTLQGCRAGQTQSWCRVEVEAQMQIGGITGCRSVRTGKNADVFGDGTHRVHTMDTIEHNQEALRLPRALKPDIW